MAQPRLIFTCWYGAAIAERADAGLRARIIDAAAEPAGRSPRRWLALVRAWRGAVLVSTTGNRGANACIVLAGLLRRRLVLLEVNEPETSRSPLRAAVHRIRLLAIRASRAHLQVATNEERERLLAAGFPPRLVHLLKWPDRLDVAAGDPPAKQDDLVLASGRRTDWVTVFAAAEGQPWALTAVCAAADVGQVRELARAHAPDAQTFSEISLEEHRAWVARAAVYVICLPAGESGSIGQVRLMDAASVGTAVVVTRLPAMTDYATGEGVLFADPGNPVDLRTQVNALLADRGLRERIAGTLTAGATRTMDDHLDDIAALLARL